MNKSTKIYGFLLLLLFVGMVVADFNKPKPLDWTPTFGIKDKIPLGLFVFDNEFPKIFKNQKCIKIIKTPYEYFDPLFEEDADVQDYSVKGTFVSISDENMIDNESTNELLSFASRGNTVFLSMKNFPKTILDSLKLKTNEDFEFKDSIYNWLSNKNFAPKKYNLLEGLGTTYFSKIDTLKTTVLGFQTGDSARINFIKIPYYKGNFILHTQPTAFSNFHLLKKNHAEYAQNLLSYIPESTIFWYIKDQNGNSISDSPFRYILKQAALKWAWYLFLIGMLFFMIFNAKRRQRIVPIQKRLTNTTVDFVKTIGNLYLQEGNHHHLIDKKIIYFLEKIRLDYLIETSVLDDFFVHKLSQKSGQSEVVVQKLITFINQFRKNNLESVASDLIKCNQLIEQFWNIKNNKII